MGLMSGYSDKCRGALKHQMNHCRQRDRMNEQQKSFLQYPSVIAAREAAEHLRRVWISCSLTKNSLIRVKQWHDVLSKVNTISNNKNGE